ncbi:hypothetical protein AGR1B_Cc110138 [Agrobacterium fabacearum S56]|nr:hypothetical protein AGR1B_Cc110138 [Agrobacterium fabacearum S56]
MRPPRTTFPPSILAASLSDMLRSILGHLSYCGLNYGRGEFRGERCSSRTKCRWCEYSEAGSRFLQCDVVKPKSVQLDIEPSNGVAAVVLTTNAGDMHSVTTHSER